MCLLIVSLIPIQSIGGFVAKKTKDFNLDFIAKNSWNLQPFGLKGVTDVFEYKIEVGKSKISGYGNNFSCSLINGDVYIENMNIEIHVNTNEDLVQIIENFRNQTSSRYYSIEIENLVVKIFVEKNDTQDIQTEEFLLSNLKFTKHKNMEIYAVEVGINKDKRTTFLTTIDRPKTDRYELNAKIENSDFFCYVYSSMRNGNINCLSKNILYLFEDIYDKKIQNDFFKTLLNKRVSLKAGINYNQNDKTNFEIIGKLSINNDIGDFLYSKKDNLFSLQFDNIDFDKPANSIQNSSEEDADKEQYAMAMTMSGKENQIISNAKKKEISENINSMSKIILYVIELTKNENMNVKIDIKNATIDATPVKNFTSSISKIKDGQIELNEVAVDFGENLKNKVLIQNKNNQNGNMLIYGESIKDFAQLLNLKILNQEIDTKNYSFTGNLKLSTESVELQNVVCRIDDKKIFDYNNSRKYNYEQKKITKNEKLIIQDININKYFNLSSIYSDLYEKFDNFQQHDKQDAVFWKKLFEKRNKEDIKISSEQFITINNSTLYGKKIDYFILEYKDDNENTDTTALANSVNIDGKIHFNLKNVDDRETINSEINIKNLDLNFSKAFLNDVKKATNRELSDIFYSDKDYNIPSLMGLNGKFDINMDNITYNDQNFTDIKGTIDLNNGVFNSENLKFRYKNGEVNSNLFFSLQGRPELQTAFAASGFRLSDIVDSAVDGNFSCQCILKAFGFNPVKFIKNISGKGHIVVRNIKIPEFDLLHLSSEIITNGLRNGFDYSNVVRKRSLAFSTGEGNILIEDGILKSDLSFSRELVSGSILLEYGIFQNILRQLSGSFAIMIAKKRLSTPFPIYIPFACNGKPEKPKCMVNWDQFNEVLLNG